MKGGSRASRTIGARQLREERRVRLRLLPGIDPIAPDDAERPRTRGDCASVPRPCPYVSCRFHLYLDVGRSGSIQLNFPDREPDELTHSCALDVADWGGRGPAAIGRLLNVTKQRAQQIEEKAMRKLKPNLAHLRGDL